MEKISFRIEDRIAYINVNHPPANSLDTVAFEELDQAMDQAASNDDVKVVVVSGEGKFFAAGADIKEFLELERDGGSEKSRIGQRVFDKIERMTKPVIAAVHGAALGGGLELALACHIRVATENAKLGLPELNLGLIPGYGGTQRLPRLIGKERATELLLTSRMVDGKEAYQLGMVSRVVAEDALMDEVNKLAKAMASKSAVALRLALEAVEEGLEGSLQEGLEREAQKFGEAFQSEDMMEGVNAFIEKRTPEFKDR